MTEMFTYHPIMDIDLSTDTEIKLRFNQLCAYFAIQVRDKTEPQNVYFELFQVVNALKEKYCSKQLKTTNNIERIII